VDPSEPCQLLIRKAEPIEIDAATFLVEVRANRVTDRIGLFEDLLEHEVAVAALFHSRGVPVKGVNRSFDLYARGIE